MRLIHILLFTLLSSCTYLLPEYVFRPEHSHCGHLPQCGGHAMPYTLVEVYDPDPMCHLRFKKVVKKDFKTEQLDVLSLYPDEVKVPYRLPHPQEQQQQEQQRQQQRQAQSYKTICTAWR